jgi:hypothetical protein
MRTKDAIIFLDRTSRRRQRLERHSRLVQLLKKPAEVGFDTNHLTYAQLDESLIKAAKIDRQVKWMSKKRLRRIFGNEALSLQVLREILTAARIYSEITMPKYRTQDQIKEIYLNENEGLKPKSIEGLQDEFLRRVVGRVFRWRLVKNEKHLIRREDDPVPAVIDVNPSNGSVPSEIDVDITEPQPESPMRR